MQRAFAKEQKMKTLPSKSKILQTYFQLVESGVIAKNTDVETLLRKRAIRSLSGIVSVQVLTKPRPCPGKCIFCPNDPTMPKSYIKSEPGAMRAFLNQFDPMKQVYNRLQSLTLTGHQPDKIELIVLGGSRDAYPLAYQEDFLKGLYDACTTFSTLAIHMHNEKEDAKYGFDILNLEDIQLSSSLSEAIERNQTAKHRVIGLTIETRPDLVHHSTCQKWREFGVTRVEMGVQSTDEEVLCLNKRGHTLETVRQAVHLMRQYGFKISLHVMPGLYGSSLEKDLQTFRTLFSDPFFKPDELKIYPTSVIPRTELFHLYQRGEYIPITTEEILALIREIFQHIIPPYTRIKRLIRDIPAPEIVAGSSITNLSQLAHEGLLREYASFMKKEVEGSVASFVQKFYARLYENTDLIQTTILGEEPDLTSFRNFVSLDTRSREVRNKKHQP
ncbi:MAG: tRNA uridine(34) 5-carboxymethylaminomethyl modification radical SAM/GNAT enzyme Elp3 [Candidatus Peribacteria bacterium]|nr:tRNA uridine(34) 5-carboxymethylaminomethyl modification radical SAM/GNAT enzyme Elp3 [Candidatus Peribacteria bacterium]